MDPMGYPFDLGYLHTSRRVFIWDQLAVRIVNQQISSLDEDFCSQRVATGWVWFTPTSGMILEA